MKTDIPSEARGEQFRLSIQAVEETGFSILERLEKRSSDTMDELQAHIKRIEKFRSFKMASEYASAIRAIEAGVVKLNNHDWSRKLSKVIRDNDKSSSIDLIKMATSLSELKGRIQYALPFEDEGDDSLATLMASLSAEIKGLSKQMRVTENKDIKRWDALMSHLNRDRWWQVWKWPVWNFRVSFTRRED